MIEVGQRYKHINCPTSEVIILGITSKGTWAVETENGFLSCYTTDTLEKFYSLVKPKIKVKVFLWKYNSGQIGTSAYTEEFLKKNNYCGGGPYCIGEKEVEFDAP